MKLWTPLLLCAWLAACGSGPAPSGTVSQPAPVPGSGSLPVRLPTVMPRPMATPCVLPLQGRSIEDVLLRVGCEGELEPGRATWTLIGDTVVLEFPPGSQGPKGAELVATWPPRDRPPWLGHRVNRVAVVADGGIRVEFGGPVRDPARLFADPRLAGVPFAVENGDVRDAIDRDSEEIVTRHDASVEYARSLGRSVHLVGFDRIYLVAFAGSTEDSASETLKTELAAGWIGRGAALARRLPPVRWESVVEMCASGYSVAATEPADPAPQSPPTVSYPAEDHAARQIAERVVSLGLPGGPFAGTVAALAGSRERMVVRPVAPGGERLSESDAAAVVAVSGGTVHPCSLYAEVVDNLRGWRGGAEPGIPTVLLVGEAAAFAVEPSSAHRR